MKSLLTNWKALAGAALAAIGTALAQSEDSTAQVIGQVLLGIGALLAGGPVAVAMSKKKV